MGIFDHEVDLFVTYRARIQFRDKLMGGIPLDPKIIEGWLRSKAGIDKEEEVKRAMLQTLYELGVDVRPDMTIAELERASESLAATKQTNGFKRDTNGLYIESRTIKAAFKECTNILFAGARWGATKKGPKSFLAERVFVSPDHVSLGRSEPDGVELFIGHTSGPKGPQSNLTYYQFADGATIEFDVMAANDAIELDNWKQIWVLMQENGLGALRSQGFGRFDLELFERIATDTEALKRAQKRQSDIERLRDSAA